MWYPAVVTEEPTADVVTVAEARAQVRVELDDNSYDADLIRMIAAAVSHVEDYTGTALAPRTVKVACTSFADFAHLPFGPVQSIEAIAYQATDGSAATIAPTDFELRAFRLMASIAPAFGKNFPPIAARSLITVEAAIGYQTVPESVRDAVLLTVATRFQSRETEALPPFTVLDALLCNHRIHG